MTLGCWQRRLFVEKLVKLGHLEEVKVVTRFCSRVIEDGFDPSAVTLTEAFAASQEVWRDSKECRCKSVRWRHFRIAGTSLELSLLTSIGNDAGADVNSIGV